MQKLGTILVELKTKETLLVLLRVIGKPSDLTQTIEMHTLTSLEYFHKLKSNNTTPTVIEF